MSVNKIENANSMATIIAETQLAPKMLERNKQKDFVKDIVSAGKSEQKDVTRVKHPPLLELDE